MVNIIRHLMRQSSLGQMHEEGVMEVSDVSDDTTQKQEKETAQARGNEEEDESEDR